MALFQFHNLLLPYQIRFAPFAHDLILLQGSKFNEDFWLPVLEEWKGSAAGAGRILTCDWPGDDLKNGKFLAEHFHRLIQTLGLHSVRVVACDDMVPMVEELEKNFPGAVKKTLLFPRHVPRGDDLKRAVREFCY